jgi:hypothetical protein
MVWMEVRDTSRRDSKMFRGFGSIEMVASPRIRRGIMRMHERFFLSSKLRVLLFLVPWV